jgi:uncharacterized protein YcsI (UPF0317 family)
MSNLTNWEAELDYRANQRQAIAEVRARENRAWAEGYDAGRAEERERDISKRWHDAIFAFLVGAICGFVVAAILNWLAK